MGSAEAAIEYCKANRGDDRPSGVQGVVMDKWTKFKIMNSECREHQNHGEQFISPYADWSPYCLVCSSDQRMEKWEFGWHCKCCGTMVDKRLATIGAP